jgi:hypothetical protein
VTASHGLPLVGHAVTAKQQVCEAIELEEPFRFIVLRGPRGFGKSRTVADTLAEAGSAVATFVGDAADTSSRTRAIAAARRTSRFARRSAPIVGVNRFKSAKEQWALVEGAADFAESVSGLGLVLGLESGGGSGGGDGGGGGAPIDSAVLADAVVRAVTREARDALRRKQRMVLLFEDMEHCDNESGQLLVAAVGELARRGAAAPLTMIVCERDEARRRADRLAAKLLVAAAPASSASAASSVGWCRRCRSAARRERGGAAAHAHATASPAGTLVTLQPLV